MSGHEQPAATTRGVKRGNVPTDRVGPVIALLVRERWPHGGGYEVLAEKVGCDQSAIASIVLQDNAGTEFDLVDNLLCALGRWDMWHGELADIYPTKFLETCALPSCNRKFPERGGGQKRKQCCSRKCSNLLTQMKLGRRTGDRFVQRGYCLKGHKLTGDNLYISPKSGQRVCQECRREAKRAWLLDPVKRAKQNEHNRKYRERRLATA